MQFKNNKTIEMQCGHINQVGRVYLHELIQSANNKGLFVNVSISISIIWFIQILLRKDPRRAGRVRPGHDCSADWVRSGQEREGSVGVGSRMDPWTTLYWHLLLLIHHQCTVHYSRLSFVHGVCLCSMGYTSVVASVVHSRQWSN